MSPEPIFPQSCGLKLSPQVRRPEKSLCPLKAVEEVTSWANSPHKADSPLNGIRILHSALHLISGPHNNWPAFCRKESAGPGSQCHSMLFSVFLPLAEHRYSTGGSAPQNKGLLFPIGGKGTAAQLGKLINPQARLSRTKLATENWAKPSPFFKDNNLSLIRLFP